MAGTVRRHFQAAALLRNAAPQRNFARCGSLFAMRRVQSILVIIAMLSAPLALLASSANAGMAACDGMCCLPHHGSHGLHGVAPVSQYHEHSKACEHGATSQPENCAMKCGQATPDYGFFSPLAPTKPSDLVSIARVLLPTTGSVATDARNFLPGFQSSPFQPPRV